MPTPPAHARGVCSTCGATADEMASARHPPLDGSIAIRPHVRQAPEVTVEVREGSGPTRGTWASPDGRGWLCKAQSGDV
jgi:hypothetical protein